MQRSIVKNIMEQIGEKNKMEILIADIPLEDDGTGHGGKTTADETLADFIDYDEGALTLADINRDLVSCGLKPIKLEQLIITGLKGK